MTRIFYWYINAEQKEKKIQPLHLGFKCGNTKEVGKILVCPPYSTVYALACPFHLTYFSVPLESSIPSQMDTFPDVQLMSNVICANKCEHQIKILELQFNSISRTTQVITTFLIISPFALTLACDVFLINATLRLAHKNRIDRKKIDY